jgi:hypothetical protein
MTEINAASTSGIERVTFYDGSQLSVAELIDSLVHLLCLGPGSDWVYETGEQLELEWPATDACVDVE